MSTIKCSECKYCVFAKGKGSPSRYYCEHKEAAKAALASARLICRCDRYDDTITIKSSPRWCPLKGEKKNDKYNAFLCT